MDPARQAAAPSCSCCTHSCMAPARRAAAPSCRPAPPRPRRKPALPQAAADGQGWHASCTGPLTPVPTAPICWFNWVFFFLFSRVLDQAFHAYCSAVCLLHGFPLVVARASAGTAEVTAPFTAIPAPSCARPAAASHCVARTRVPSLTLTPSSLFRIDLFIHSSIASQVVVLSAPLE
jgi:hypothetical protein